ncbi:hypothetical protein [Streptomyces sp. URMC 123]|uniref:hypothetical protein n=1 Tax=Streptomyces sp. URMC 123 TaxID=3423403 RepID=UPI003F1E2063
MSLPGADELFRTTGGMALQPSSPRQHANGEAAKSGAGGTRVPAPAGSGETDPAGGADGGPGQGPGDGREGAGAAPAGGSAEHGGRDSGEDASGTAGERAAARSRRGQDGSAPAGQPGGRAGVGAPPQPGVTRRRGRGANRRPSGRERHDEKITVYVSAEELMDLEHARLVLRGEHGLAVDRGRIVREAVAVVLADLESRGDASILVRRLRGR